MGRKVPDGWVASRLGDHINLKRGYDLPRQDRRAGAVPVVSSSGPSGFHDVAKVKAPGVVTGRYGTIGQVFMLEEDYWPLNTSLYVQDFKGNDPTFVAALLRTVNWAAHNGKSGVPGINRNDVHEDVVMMPPPPEQRAIASVLGALDDKIASNRRAADAADEAWLMRASAAFGGGKKIQVSELISAGDLVVNDGYRAKNSELATEGVPFIRAGNLTDDGLELDGADRVPPEVVLRAGIKVAAPWDTAFTSKGTVGRITLVGPAPASFVYSPQVCFWRSTKTEQLSPLVVHAWMRSNRFTAQVDAVKGQTDMADYVSLRDQRAMEFDLPTSEAQRDVVQFAEPLARLAAAQRAESLTLAALCDALLPKLVSGQIRVPLSDGSAEALGTAVEADELPEAQVR